MRISDWSSDVCSSDLERLTLGKLSIIRDWGWAPESVEAMWKMLQREEPDDYVIATVQSHSLEKFVELAFMEAGLDFRDHVAVAPDPFRPTDLALSKANPSQAHAALGWRAASSRANRTPELSGR